jgi:uncharacterized membrane protein YoaK (UPF0700 family)
MSNGEVDNKKRNAIRFLTLVLTLTAGYCDSLTFVAADKIFSAHVTGNFIVFAYQIIVGTSHGAWGSLLTFPVFILSVMVGGWLIAAFSNEHFLFFCEGIILLIAGMIACLADYPAHANMTTSKYLVTMMVVLAMGLQNAAGRIFAKETYGPTTMMTGNVTQFALDIRAYFGSGFKTSLLPAIVKGATTLGGFLAGCIIGAYSGHYIGLPGILLPGVTMMFINI